MNEKKIICQQIYPILYRQAAEQFIFYNLPFFVNERIHHFRDLRDFQIEDTKIEKILGYGQSIAKDEILDRIQQCADWFLDGSNDFRADKEVTMITVTRIGYFLKYASENLRNDKQVVMTAVAQDSHAFQYASDRLKNDEKCVAAACRKYIFTFSCASDPIRQDVRLADYYFAIARSGLPKWITDDIIWRNLGVVRY